MLMTKYWWEFLDVGDKIFIKVFSLSSACDVGDSDGQSCHQNLKLVINIFASLTSVTNIDVVEHLRERTLDKVSPSYVFQSYRNHIL